MGNEGRKLHSFLFYHISCDAINCYSVVILLLPCCNLVVAGDFCQTYVPRKILTSLRSIK